MSDPTPLIQAHHLSLRFGETEVFSDLDFSIISGSFTSIIGPNGAGKTQLMRVILGLLEPSNGTIIRNFSLSEVGYVPQQIQIDPTFPITVHEFLQVYLQTRGLWTRQALPEFDARLAIDRLFSKQLGRLSGGQFQRVILGAILSTKPRILLLDEFSSGIDPQGQAELFNYLHRLNEKDGVTIVMISHDIDVTAQYADDVLCLNKRMVCHGRPHEVFTAENFEKMYGIPLTKLQPHQHGQ